MDKIDFSGWATKNDLRCGDGRTIRKDAFKDCDGKTVPLIWNHDHSNPDAVLGHALLANREDGVYAYCSFNDSEQRKAAKTRVQHGDVRSLSIYANRLKQIGGDVVHGIIRELSLVLAGANPGAYVDFVMAHGEDEEGSLYASYDENIMLYHSDDKSDKEKKEDVKEMADETKKTEGSEKTVQDVIDSMSEEQKTVMYAMVGMAREEAESKQNNNEGEGEDMKHNLFDKDVMEEGTLCHADEEAIMNLAKSSSVGSFQEAMKIYAENELSHAAIDGEVMDALFPDYKDVYPGEPETLTDDQTWIGSVISGVHKSPISRVRTRQLDARNRRNRAKGYKKGNYIEEGTNVALLS